MREDAQRLVRRTIGVARRAFGRREDELGHGPGDNGDDGLYTCTALHMHIYIHMFVYADIHTYVYMYAYTYTCMYVYI